MSSKKTRKASDEAAPNRKKQKPSTPPADTPAPAITATPRPLTIATGVPAAFPIDALGPIMGPAAHGIAYNIQVPDAMAATSVLTAMALAVQAHADVKLPYGAVHPISVFALEISESGDRKSSADEMATQALKQRRSQLIRQYKTACAAYKCAAANGQNVPPPKEPTFLISDPTAEGIFRAAQVGQPTLGLFSAEGGGFLGGHGFTQDAKLRTMVMLSSLWDGEPLSRTRGTEPAQILEGKRLSTHLMCQPSVVASLLIDPEAKGQGFLPRFLITAPASLKGKRLYREADQNHKKAIDHFNARVAEILAVPMPFLPGGDDVLNPREIPFSERAADMWKDYHDRIEVKLGPDGALANISGFGAKLAEQCARIGAILALADDLHAAQIEDRHIAAAIQIVDHYEQEAVRLFTGIDGGQNLAQAEELGKWLLARHTGKFVPLKEILHYGPKQLRTAEKAKQVLAKLEEYSWVIKAEPVTIGGCTYREAWFVVSP